MASERRRGRLDPAAERAARRGGLPDLPPDGRSPRGERRPCANCGRRFQPTIKRRMLCANCFARGTGSPFEP